MINIPNDIKKIFEGDGFTIVTRTIEGEELFDRVLKKDATGNTSPGAVSMDGLEGHTVTDKIEKVPDRKGGLSQLKSAEFDIPTIIDYLKWHMQRIAENVIGRDDIIKQVVFAILTGEHMLLLSRTGMAKSYLANYIFNSFEGARVFSSQASKDQTPDNYFGPYNIEEFKKGHIRHNIKGSIIEANFVFLDEFFDASDVVLRSLLTVLNERKFINGSEKIDAAIHTSIATANYMRMNEVTEAVLDRFNYKAIIPENSDVYKQLLIDHTYQFSGGVPVDPDKKIYFNQILYLHDIVKNRNKDIRVNVPDFIYFMKNVLINKFVSEMRKSDYNFFLSPRKIAKTGDFLRASALINNRFIVTEDDLKEMYNTLCTLNSFVSIKAKDKSEVDVFLDIYQQTMVHYKATGAINQIEFLLNVRRVLQEIREDPDKREAILAKKGLLQGLKDILKKIFPTRRSAEDDKLTIENLKKNVLDLNPAVEEVAELKSGILKDYTDIY